MNAPRPTAEQPPCRYWIAVSVPAARVDDDLPDALSHAANHVETVLQEERGYEATAWRAAAPGRAEVLREAAAAVDSGNRFPEPVRGGAAWAGRMLRRMADEAPREELAAVVARVGALPVPAGHTEPAAPDFFQPGRTYRSGRCGDFRFRCLTVDAHPDTGHLRAFGWRYSATPNVWRPTDLDADDWACCGWTETTEESAR